MAGRPLLKVILTISISIAARIASADDVQQQAIPIEGRPFAARLSSIDADWKLMLVDAEQRRQIDADKLVRWGAQRDWRSGRLILLADGSKIVAKRIKITDRQLIVYSNLWDGVKVPLETVRGILFRPPADPLKRDRLIEKIATAKAGQDRLLLENGDIVRGVFVESPAEKKQPSGDADLFDNDQRHIHLRTDSGTVAVGVERIIALTFNPSLIARAKPSRSAVLVGFRDGSALHVEKVATQQNRVTWTLAGGTTLATDPVWEEVVHLQGQSPRVVYLSDLKPIGYKHIAYLELFWPYGTDRSVQGGLLRSGKRVYAKGLCMHSTSRLAYDLDGDYRRFQAELAIDQLAGRKGSVVFRVYLTDGGKWQMAYESPIVRGGQKPLPISVDISKARRLALIVDMSDRGDEWDHGNWLDARLVRGND